MQICTKLNKGPAEEAVIVFLVEFLRLLVGAVELNGSVVKLPGPWIICIRVATTAEVGTPDMVEFESCAGGAGGTTERLEEPVVPVVGGGGGANANTVVMNIISILATFDLFNYKLTLPCPLDWVLIVLQALN